MTTRLTRLLLRLRCLLIGHRYRNASIGPWRACVRCRQSWQADITMPIVTNTGQRRNIVIMNVTANDDAGSGAV